MKSYYALVYVSGLSLIFGSALAAPNLQEGNWENAIEMRMEGLPFPMPPMKFKTTQCLTQKDLVPNTAQKNQKCEVKEQKVAGNKVAWKYQCVEKDATTEGDGEITYNGNNYHGNMHMRTVAKDGSASPMTMRYTLDGRHLGPCKSGQ